MKVFIEITKGSNVKYEFNKEDKVLELDRILHSAVYYPQNYGFLPNTLCEDGDELDVLVFTEPILPGTQVECRAVGFLEMYDEKGRDEKLICVATKDPRYKDVKDITDLPKHCVNEIVEFFKTYKNLEENKWVTVKNVYGFSECKNLIKQCKLNYSNNERK